MHIWPENRPLLINFFWVRKPHFPPLKLLPAGAESLRLRFAAPGGEDHFGRPWLHQRERSDDERRDAGARRTEHSGATSVGESVGDRIEMRLLKRLEKAASKSVAEFPASYV